MASGVDHPPLDKYNLVTGILQSWLFGVNCIVFMGAIHVLVRRIKPSSSQSLLLITSALLFISAAGHFCGSAVRLTQAFIYAPRQGVTPSEFFGILSTPVEIACEAFYQLSFYLQDFVLLWRMYVIWEKKWKVVVVPAFILVSVIVISNVSACYAFSPNISIFGPVVKGTGYTVYSLELLFNVGVTATIVLRLFWAHRRVSHLTAVRTLYMSTIIVIVECGALFTTITLVNFVIYLSGSALAVAMLGPVTQVAALSPLLIIVQVGFGLTWSGGSGSSGRGSSRQLEDGCVQVTVQRDEESTVAGSPRVSTVAKG